MLRIPIATTKHLSINNLVLWYGNQAHNHCQTAMLFLDKYKAGAPLVGGICPHSFSLWVRIQHVAEPKQLFAQGILLADVLQRHHPGT